MAILELILFFIIIYAIFITIFLINNTKQLSEEIQFYKKIVDSYERSIKNHETIETIYKDIVENRNNYIKNLQNIDAIRLEKESKYKEKIKILESYISSNVI